MERTEALYVKLTPAAREQLRRLVTATGLSQCALIEQLIQRAIEEKEGEGV